MKLSSNRFFQWFVGLLFAATFIVLAFILIQKQKKPYGFQSFINPAHSTSIVINDIDRVCNKKLTSDVLNIENKTLKFGYDEVVLNGKSSYNEVLGKHVLLSFNAENFCVVFENSNLSVGLVLEIIENDFGYATAKNQNKITIEDKSYFYAQFNNYLVFSNTEIVVNEEEFESIRFGNADYVKLNNGQQERYLIAPEITYMSYSTVDSIKGKPVGYKDAFSVIPSDFTSVEFYGSQRFFEDQAYFFTRAEAGYFSWCESYLAVIKKDSLEIIISPIGLQRDLKLILEEETLSQLGDTAQILPFNITTHEVFEILPKQNWAEAIPACHSPMKYFSQLANYNVLSNSKEALNWLFSSFQIGNIFSKSDNLSYVMQHYLPYQMNQLSMVKSEIGWSVKGKVNESNEVLFAELELRNKSQELEEIKSLFEKDLNFQPSQIFVTGLKENSPVLIFDQNNLMAVNISGQELFSKSLKAPIVKIQMVDFENNGTNEMALFTNSGLDVINEKGVSLAGFPIVINEKCYGGKILNYDHSFDHRLFIGHGNTVSCYNELGQKVEGWQFEGMNAPLYGDIRYTQVEGKDFIIFQNTLNKFYTVNRRGELRNPPSASIRCESFAEGVKGNNATNLYVTGYNKGYLYRYYILNQARDSVSIDLAISPSNIGWVLSNNDQCLWLMQDDQFFQFDKFGFVTKKILKPNSFVSFAGFITQPSEIYVFAENDNKKLYLLNERGELITDSPLQGSPIWAVSKDVLFSCSGSKLIAYELN